MHRMPTNLFVSLGGHLEKAKCELHQQKSSAFLIFQRGKAFRLGAIHHPYGVRPLSTEASAALR